MLVFPWTPLIIIISPFLKVSTESKVTTIGFVEVAFNIVPLEGPLPPFI